MMKGFFTYYAGFSFSWHRLLRRTLIRPFFNSPLTIHNSRL